MKLVALGLLAASVAAGAQTSLVVPKDAGILVRLEQTLDTAEAVSGAAVRFSVAQDFVVNGRLIAKAGAPVSASLSEVATGRRWGRGGKLIVVMKEVELADGEKLPLDASLEEGSARFGFALAGDALGLLGAPLGAIFTGAHAYRDRGYETVLPEGTLLVALPSQVTPLEERKFAPGAQSKEIVPMRKRDVRELTVTGSESGAMVELDHGKPFAAPHTFQVTGGLHDLVVRAKGYEGWERALPVEGTPLTVTFRLDPVEAKK